MWCLFAVCVLSALVEQGVLWSSCGLNTGAVSMWGCWTGDWVACSQALLTFHAHHLQLQLENKARLVRPVCRQQVDMPSVKISSKLCRPMEHFLT
jgi:hypothetical protein